MRLLPALSLYFITVFIGGALLAPLLHAVLAWASEPLSFLEKLANQPFHRYVNRCFLVLAILGLWPLSRLAKLSAAEAGWCRSPSWKRMLAAGLCVGFASLALPAIMCVGTGQRLWQWPGDAGHIMKHFGNAVGAAVLVSVLEEAVFRGVLFGTLRKHGPLVVAALFSSGVYALVHFFERTRHEGDVIWSSGLAILPKMLCGFGDWQVVIPGFFSLMVAGLILAAAVHRTRSLYFSIGVHAAWIFWLKTFGFFTQAAPDGNAWLWGTGKLIDGWFALLALLLTWWLVVKWNFFLPSSNEETDDGDTTGRMGQ
jgi:membrane protease YdiL (CAAX protease family)